MRILNFLLAVMFLGFASVQINDPDPITWILIYGSMAAVCVMASFEYYIRWLMILQFVCYTLYCVVLFPSIHVWLASSDRTMLFDELAKMQYPYIEESREFLGLVICMTVLVGYGFRALKASKKAS
jgi:hypothetical protein